MWVRKAAATALGQIGAVQAVPHLIVTLRDCSILVREAAARALGEIAMRHPHAADQAVPGLLAALESYSVWVRKTAAWALGRIRDARAVPSLIERLDDDGLPPSYLMGKRVCDEAAAALRRIGTRDALAALNGYVEGQGSSLLEIPHTLTIDV